MNRAPVIVAVPYSGVPRVRGDEPNARVGLGDAENVFPACAGMNRADILIADARARVPRVRGDEPRRGFQRGEDFLCSPRARG